MRLLIGVAAVVLGVVFGCAASAHEYSEGTITIVHPTAGATPNGATTGAAYMQIVNKGKKTIRIKSISTPVAGKVEIHKMVVTNGIMRMRALGGPLKVAPGRKLELNKGNLHLMLIGLKQPLVEEEMVPLRIEFVGGKVVQVELYVEAIGEAGGPIKGHEGH